MHVGRYRGNRFRTLKSIEGVRPHPTSTHCCLTFAKEPPQPLFGRPTRLGLFDAPTVRRVSFVGNPVVKLAGYRLFVIAHLPKLRELDGTYVEGSPENTVLVPADPPGT